MQKDGHEKTQAEDRAQEGPQERPSEGPQEQAAPQGPFALRKQTPAV